MIQVAIADDQHLFAESLQFVLQGASNGQIQVIGIAENGEEAVRMVEKNRPDVILMDVRMPVMDGVEATKIIHRDFPETKVLILTTFDDDDLAVAALSSGATGYVLKDVHALNLIRSIESVADGAFYFAPSVGMKLVHMINPDDQQPLFGKEDFVVGSIAQWPELTRREAEIVYHVALAFTNAEIGERLHISHNTVKNHMSSIFEKLGIRSRLQLIALVAPVLEKLKV
jgi:DNA-binding NarL/FixJ family response regulator